MYITIRLDIKESRLNSNYKKMSNLHNSIKKRINNKIESYQELEIRNGDELFGIYEDINNAMKVVEAILVEAKMNKINIYLGLGIGNIDYGIDEGAHTVNGSSIWNATEALDSAKTKGNTASGNTCCVYTNFKKAYTDTLNLLLNIAVENIENRTQEQQKAIDLKRNNPDKSPAELYLALKGIDEHNNLSESSEKKLDNYRVNFSRFITRSELSRFNEILGCMIGICNDQSLSEVNK